MILSTLLRKLPDGANLRLCGGRGLLRPVRRVGAWQALLAGDVRGAPRGRVAASPPRALGGADERPSTRLVSCEVSASTGYCHAIDTVVSFGDGFYSTHSSRREKKAF